MKPSDLWIVTLIIQICIVAVALITKDWALVFSAIFGCYMCVLYRHELKRHGA